MNFLTNPRIFEYHSILSKINFFLFLLLEVVGVSVDLDLALVNSLITQSLYLTYGATL